MAVLIKGMEMPKEGQVIVIDSTGQVWTNEWPTRGYFRNDKAKAVPVPPHGRLIDADAFEGDLVRRIEMYYSWQQPRQASAVDCARMDLYAAPTIIEAEGLDE